MRELEISVYLDDCVKVTEDLILQIEDAPERTIRLVALGNPNPNPNPNPNRNRNPNPIPIPIPIPNPTLTPTPTLTLTLGVGSTIACTTATGEATDLASLDFGDHYSNRLCQMEVTLENPNP